jgi:hypothetical protein
MVDRTSKYSPLHRFLLQQYGPELPLSFREVESVLGFALPPSARIHPAWWSNNRGTNVAVKAWRDAGWRTSRVDLAGERVTFVREVARSGPAQPFGEPPLRAVTGVEDAGAPFERDDAIVVQRAALRGGAMRMLEDYCEAQGGDLAQAVVSLLNGMALERRRQLLERFPMQGAPSDVDSAALIREDRDAR